METCESGGWRMYRGTCRDMELTLRQAYYQLVARGYIPNNERSYKNNWKSYNDGRLAGLIDWP